MAKTVKRVSTVAEYLASLTPERRALVSKVRAFVRQHLPRGYTEMIGWGVIAWCVPLKEFRETYNGQPLCITALASNKNYCTLHLLGAYGSPKLYKVLQDGYKAAGKKFDMGKGCLHFKTWDDIETTSVARVLAAIPKAEYLAMYATSRKRR